MELRALACEVQQLIEDAKRAAYVDAWQIVRASGSIDTAVELLKMRAQGCGIEGVSIDGLQKAG